VPAGWPRSARKLAEAREQAKALRLHWNERKGAVDKVRKLRESLEAAAWRWRKAERAYDLNTVANCATARFPSWRLN